MAFAPKKTAAPKASAPSNRLDALSARNYMQGEEEKTAWLRIGTAFVNEKDNSIKVVLQAMPVDGVIHLRTPLPPKE